MGLVVVRARQIRPASWGCCVTVVYYCCVSVRRRGTGGISKTARKGNGIVVRAHVAQSFPCDGPQIPSPLTPTSLPSGLLEACRPCSPRRPCGELSPLDPAPASVLRRIPAYAGHAGDACDAGDAGDALLALLNIPHHHPSQPIAGAVLCAAEDLSLAFGGKGNLRSLVLLMSHHSGEAFILILRVLYPLCVCVCVFSGELFFCTRSSRLRAAAGAGW